MLTAQHKYKATLKSFASTPKCVVGFVVPTEALKRDPHLGAGVPVSSSHCVVEMLRLLSWNTFPKETQGTPGCLWAFSDQKFGFRCLLGHSKMWEGGGLGEMTNF